LVSVPLLGPFVPGANPFEEEPDLDPALMGVQTPNLPHLITVTHMRGARSFGMSLVTPETRLLGEEDDVMVLAEEDENEVAF